jgi:deoxyribodipyrimidine photo-lyase
MGEATTIVWFRQDLRLADQPALSAAAQRGRVVPAYIWAPEEEGRWPPGAASRWWLHHSLASLKAQLEAAGSRLVIRRGPSLEALTSLVKEAGATAVVWNRRYEPAAIARDQQVKAALLANGIHAESFNGSLLYEPWTIATKQGGPFQVFTPFWKACLAAGDECKPLGAPDELAAPRQWPAGAALDELNLLPAIPWDRGFYDAWQPGALAAEAQLAAFVAEGLGDYDAARDRVDVVGTSRLSPHLHVGELSPRQVRTAVERATAGQGARSAKRQAASVFLKELGWREFAHHLLYHFPRTTDEPLRESFRRFPWRRSARDLRRWHRGETGYPIVDAAMRQLWTTGYMPNRTRMIVASFLTKHLRLPWQRGAEWFWDTLVDADLANNTLGWQWTAGCGADAAPYFRVFNPVLQAARCDPEAAYIRRWAPELERLAPDDIYAPWRASDATLASARVRLGATYPAPMVDHDEARAAALAAFDSIRGG